MEAKRQQQTERSPGFAQEKRAMLERLIRERAANSNQTATLSYGQRALWFLHEVAPNSVAYHIGFSLYMEERPDKNVLRRALQHLVDRHAMLRTTFSSNDGEPQLTVAGARDVAFEVVDADGWSEQQLHAAVVAAYREPFNLSDGPLFRAHVFERGEQGAIFLITVHHIVYDGWSLWLNMGELASLYVTELRGLRPTLPKRTPDYIEFINAERSLIDSGEFDGHWEYWQKQLCDVDSPLNLPTDRPRPKIQQHSGASCHFRIPSALTQRINALARTSNVTPFTLLLTVYQILLHRYSRQDDVVVGVPVNGHNRGDYASTVGYFVNQVPVRADLSENPTFVELLDNTRVTFMEALEHQCFPFSLMVERLCPQRDASYAPLVQASFVYQKSQSQSSIGELFNRVGTESSTDWAGLPVRLYPLPQQEGQFDLELEIAEAGEGLYAIIKYDSSLFDEESALRIQDHFLQLLNRIVDNPDRRVREYPLLSHEQRKQLTQCSQLPASQLSSLVELFRSAATKHPDAVAVHCAGVEINYRDLDERSNQLARYLTTRGVEVETPVGLLLPRSIDLIVAVLAIVKAGGCYVPVDPGSPEERINYVLQDAQVGLLLSDDELLSNIDIDTDTIETVSLQSISSTVSSMDASPTSVSVSQHNAAYVIYTSGSTGRPKGVVVTHANVVRLFFATEQWFRFSADDVWTLFHSIAFDFSVWEFWGALLHGGRLVVVPYEISRSPDEFYELLCQQRVTILNQTPSAFRQLAAAEERLGASPELSLRKVIFGGEALDPSSLTSWFERHGDSKPQLINMYGITETTVHVTYRALSAADALSSTSAIGEPIPDLQLFILDENLEPVPTGVPGELFVGGAGIARGYLDRPELTEQRFIKHPFSRVCGDRLYRTGDLARRLNDGDIEYLGRIDSQVKIRGFRIELGEIQSHLARHENVSEAVVLARKFSDDDHRLIAWVVPKTENCFDAGELASHLASFLPAYMVPAHILALDEFPLTNNGKLDHRRLPNPSVGIANARAVAVPPTTETQRKLVEIWQSVLGIQPIGIRDDFFAVGGHSLLAIRIISAIETVFQVKLPLSTIFRFPTIEQLSIALETRCDNASSTLVPMREQGEELPLFCVAGGGGNVAYFGELVRHLDSRQPFYALQAPGLDGNEPPLHHVEDIAKVHIDAIRNVQAHGPYRLAGHCFGAHVAFEMARQLSRDGQAVQCLIVIDAPAPLRPPPDLSAVDEFTWLQRIALALEEASGRLLNLDYQKLHDLGSEQKYEYFYQQMIASELLESSATLEQAKGFIAVFKANTQARYVPGECIDVPVHLIRAAQWHADYDYSEAGGEAGSDTDSDLGWQQLSVETVAVSSVPGNHLTMLNESNVAALATVIQDCLQTDSSSCHFPDPVVEVVSSSNARESI